MQNNQTATPAGDAPILISIEYYGEAREEAEQIRSELAQSPAQLTDVRECDPEEADLAVAEIIITIIVTAAAKAAASTALGYFEAYIRRRIEEGKNLPDGQLVIKRKEGDTVDRIPFSSRTMGLEMVAEFSKNLRSAIDKI